MSIQKLRSLVRRGSLFAAAFSLLAGALVPTLAYADALNPLTERSLTLSSSSPGWANTDGSGNSTYAPPNSGANGQKTGNYFSFKVSSDSTGTPIKAMSFQYCTQPAGDCIAPGDDATSSTPGSDDSSHADLNVNYQSPSEVVAGANDFDKVIDSTTGNVKAVPGYTNENPKYQFNGGTGDPAEAAKNVAGTFIVMTNASGSWAPSADWTASTSNQEEATGTGKQNTIILTNTGSGLGIPAGTAVKVLFFANANNYITNPGSGAFFVKINTFNNFPALAGPTPGPENTLRDNLDPTKGYVIDGGVTVANVMNQSIQITTKVLETMEFSVGTVDPNTLDSTNGGSGTQSDYEAAENMTAPSGANPHATHGVCDTILKSASPTDPQNVLQLGDQSSESSLSTKVTYATHSYWRLSSNSSAGATVYYSGHTLSNTSGDEITPMDPSKHGGLAQISHQGSEQFGLAIDQVALTPVGGTSYNTATYGVDYSQDRQGGTKDYENAADNGKTAVNDSVLTDNGAVLTPSADYTNLNGSYHTPRLDPLTPEANYANGAGKINNDSLGTGNASFSFDPMSDTVPAPIASESAQVVDCVTAKMRYIGNIAATTPAGIYTTKVNYIAAPQY